ncbi:MAG TPA: VOC family protein [Thermomicrobiales bacterium]|nr:VOC family protein [Thermomicrobiales bacterium]
MEPKMFMLYVSDMDASVALYHGVLGIEPDRPTPAFASFLLSSGLRFDLVLGTAVDPAPTAGGGAIETCFLVDSRGDVERVHDLWRARGLPIALAPQDKPFGYTLVGVDPDGHRLRVIGPSVDPS